MQGLPDSTSTLLFSVETVLQVDEWLNALIVQNYAFYHSGTNSQNSYFCDNGNFKTFKSIRNVDRL